MILYKYQGAGNDFLMADNRDGRLELDAETVQCLCDRHYGIGADGIILLGTASDYDFSMDFFNPDGSTGMMCGNGGRCAVAFAADLGLTGFYFLGPDGPHMGEILLRDGKVKTVRIGMKDVEGYELVDGKVFMDTGTRHLVVPVHRIGEMDVYSEGRKLRYDPRFAPAGTNVDFIEWKGDILHVRTYEKGVEGETLACGTGIVASALGAFIFAKGTPGRHETRIHARRDDLSVSFEAGTGMAGTVFRGVALTGPAAYVARIEV